MKVPSLSLLLLLSVALFAQSPKANDPLENLRQAIKLLEQEIPEAMYPNASLLGRRAEKKQQEMIEIQSKLMAVDLIQKYIQSIEVEKQKVRVVPALPSP